MVEFNYYIDRFLNYIGVEKNYSPHTVLNYRIDLIEFNDFLLAQGGREVRDHVCAPAARGWTVGRVVWPMSAAGFGGNAWGFL